MRNLFRLGAFLLLAAVGLPMQVARGADEWVKLLPITPETEAAAAKALDGCPPRGRETVSGVNRNGVYMLAGDLFRNGGIYAVIGDRMTVTICQWNGDSWKAALSLDAGIGWDHPGNLCGEQGETSSHAKPFWILSLQNQPLLAIASDAGPVGRNYYTVMFDAPCQNIVEAFRSVDFVPVVKHDYLVTREESRWREWSVAHFFQFQAGKLVERKTWEEQRQPWLCWTVRSDGTAFKIMHGQSPDQPTFATLRGASDAARGAKAVQPADWMIYSGENVRGMEPSLLRLEPWARLYCRLAKSPGAASDVLEEKELAYLFAKFTGLPPELYPAGEEFPFRENVRRGLSVRVTGSKEAVELLSLGR